MHVQLSACCSSNCPFTCSRGTRQKNPKWRKRFFVTEKLNKTKKVLLTHHVWLTANITWSKDMHSIVRKRRGKDYSCSFSLPQMNGKRDSYTNHWALWLILVIWTLWYIYEIIGSLSSDVLERYTSNGSNAFCRLICLDITTFVLRCFFTLIQTICPKILAKTLPKN